MEAADAAEAARETAAEEEEADEADETSSSSSLQAGDKQYDAKEPGRQVSGGMRSAGAIGGSRGHTRARARGHSHWAHPSAPCNFATHASVK